jgi:transposase-like protein
LVISDHRTGLKNAAAECFVAAASERCQVHFMQRNVLTKVKRANREMVATAIRTIFAQPTADAVFSQFDRIVDTLAAQFPEVAALLVDAGVDLLAFSGFPIEHWRDLASPARPVAPRSEVAHRRRRRLAQRPAIDRFVTAVIVEQHEWTVAERGYLSETQSPGSDSQPRAVPAVARGKRLVS